MDTLKTLSIEEFPFAVKENYKFFKVNENIIFYQNKTEFYFAGAFNNRRIIDSNLDGNDELIESSSGECACGCPPPASIAIWNGKEINEIYNQYGNINLDFKGKLVIETLTQYDGDPYSSDPNRKPKIGTNYYEIKNFELVPTKKRPK